MYYLNAAAFTALLATLPSVVPFAQAQPNGQSKSNQRGGFRIEPYRPPNYWAIGHDKPSQKVLNLKRKAGQKSHSAGYLQALRNGNQVDGVYGSEEVDVTDTGVVFATEVEVGGNKYEMVIDTGSSDTWLPKSNYQCVRVGTGDFIPQSECGLASTYKQTSTFRPVNGLNYYVQYTDGESLRGTFGIEQIKVAGITVKNQQFALVDTAAWNGDTATSGLLGLAYPAGTKAFKGSNYLADSPANQQFYNPIFTNMYTEGHVAPLFSIALDRNEGGQLAFGGLPPVRFFPAFASSPLQILTTSSGTQSSAASTSAYTLYTITTNGFSYNNASMSEWTWSTWPNPLGRPSDPTEIQVIIDTATVNIFLPQTTADAVNKLFEPRPSYKTAAGLYVVDCKAKPPQFGVKIGFETFYINPEDMIVKLGGQCISAVAAVGPGGTSILGEAFLKNVLAVFDVGAHMMRFAAREYY